jgi:hypothetical protein
MKVAKNNLCTSYRYLTFMSQIRNDVSSCAMYSRFGFAIAQNCAFLLDFIRLMCMMMKGIAKYVPGKPPWFPFATTYNCEAVREYPLLPHSVVLKKV